MRKHFTITNILLTVMTGVAITTFARTFVQYGELPEDMRKLESRTSSVEKSIEKHESKNDDSFNKLLEKIERISENVNIIKGKLEKK
jgi:uncharacterized membrane protein (DUF106 family)